MVGPDLGPDNHPTSSVGPHLRATPATPVDIRPCAWLQLQGLRLPVKVFSEHKIPQRYLTSLPGVQRPCLDILIILTCPPGGTERCSCEHFPDGSNLLLLQLGLGRGIKSGRGGGSSCSPHAVALVRGLGVKAILRVESVKW
jgi:hypothetical protein